MLLMDLEGQTQNVDPVKAAYWVVVTMTTLGYGDIVFHSDLGYLFAIIVSLSGIALLWAVVVPIGITPNLERLIQAQPNSVPDDLSGHVIICGYNPIVETLVERFSLQRTPFLIIERSEARARQIYRKYPVLWSDPSSAQALYRARIKSARLFIANESDEQNAEVILTIREISEIEIIALVDDLTRSRFLRYAGASRIISPKTLLGTFIAQIATPPVRNVFPGAISLFGDLLLAEIPVFPGSQIMGLTLDDPRIRDAGAGIVGIWEKGHFRPGPDSKEAMRPNSVLMAVGNLDQLSGIRELATGQRRAGPQIILGYGDVGRRVTSVLSNCGIRPTILDRSAIREADLMHSIGDATSEEDLVRAGIKDAVGVMIMLNLDSDAVYATLLAKNLNPNAFVVVRANHLQSAEKIYRAGADYVASVPIVASHMLARIIQGEEETLDLLYEDLELKILHVSKGSHLLDRSIAELDLPQRFGCRIVAIERMGAAVAVAVSDEGMTIAEGDILALIGSPTGIEAFSRRYDRTALRKRLYFFEKIGL